MPLRLTQSLTRLPIARGLYARETPLAPSGAARPPPAGLGQSSPGAPYRAQAGYGGRGQAGSPPRTGGALGPTQRPQTMDSPVGVAQPPTVGERFGPTTQGPTAGQIGVAPTLTRRSGGAVTWATAPLAGQDHVVQQAPLQARMVDVQPVFQLPTPSGGQVGTSSSGLIADDGSGEEEEGMPNDIQGEGITGPSEDEITRLASLWGVSTDVAARLYAEGYRYDDGYGQTPVRHDEEGNYIDELSDEEREAYVNKVEGQTAQRRVDEAAGKGRMAIEDYIKSVLGLTPPQMSQEDIEAFLEPMRRRAAWEKAQAIASAMAGSARGGHSPLAIGALGADIASDYDTQVGAQEAQTRLSIQMQNVQAQMAHWSEQIAAIRQRLAFETDIASRAMLQQAEKEMLRYRDQLARDYAKFQRDLMTPSVGEVIGGIGLGVLGGGVLSPLTGALGAGVGKGVQNAFGYDLGY